MKIKTSKGLKVTIFAVVLLLCLALAIGITGAFYQAKRQATGTLSMDQGIIIDYNGFDKTAAEDWATWTRGVTLPLFKTNDAQPGQNIPVNPAGIRANAESVNFYARVKLSYKFYNGETPVELADATKLIKTSSNFFGTNWVESGDGYYYYATGSTLNTFAKTATTFVDFFAADAKFIIEGAGFTGADNNGEGGGFKIDDTTSINKIEVYLTLETLQGDADAAAEGWKITEVVKPIEVDITTEEKPEINIDDIISDDKKDGEITIAGDPTAMKTILIGSRAFEGCTNLRLKLNNSSNITYIIASDAFSEGAKIWYGSSEATNLLINADTTGKTAGKDNAWVVAEPNLKVFLPTGVTQNSTNTSYGKYQYTDDQGTWYFDLIDSSGNTVTLSSTNNMSVSTLSASTYANTNNYKAELNKFEPKDGVTIINIPKFIGISQDSNKYAVAQLYQTFRDCTTLTSITIPDSVTSIGVYAFSSCRGLTSIVIPEGVTTIGTSAFFDCSSLLSIAIPESVTSIGGNVFGRCYSLISIHIGAAIQEVSWLPDNVLEITISISKDNPYLSTDSKAIFTKSNGELSVSKYISADTNYDIPSAINGFSVTSIGYSAFAECYDLTSITIPNSVISIGVRSFYMCESLTSITIPDSVTSIGDTAFLYCSGLTSITVDIGNSVYHSAGNCVIETASKTLIVGCKNSIIPTDGSVTSIGYSAFSDCYGLASITIPDSVISIGDAAFSGCSGLTSITIPDSVKSIGEQAFSGCNGLTSVVIKGNITDIKYQCFAGCSNLESIVLPSSVKTIGDVAFGDCSKLTTIYVDSADATAITGLGFTKADNTQYNEKGEVDPNGKYYKYSGTIA